MIFRPSYLDLLENGELKERAEEANGVINSCNGCAWECGVDRTAGELGQCKTGIIAKVSSYSPHLGEENPLRGWRGSGTIFFTRCNMHCQFCQNADISQTDYGQEMDAIDLATVMIHLQKLGCHNINFVSPSHVVPQIITAVLIAAESGLELPLVYNTGGYDSIASLKLLDGIIDIYMPDMKYADAEVGKRLSGTPNYPQFNQAAVKEMHRQVGDLKLDKDGIATKGLLVRHLVLPNGLAGTEEITSFLANEISKDTYINVMAQYRPTYQAHMIKEINQHPTREEYMTAVTTARRAGLHRLD